MVSMSRGLDDTISAAEADLADSGLELSVGQEFAGRYDVEGILGRGGMGAVYRVRDRALGEVVALKLLTLSTERAVERFRGEVRLARRVTHPNVARIHDFGEVGAVRYLTMEYVEGRALESILDEEKKLDPERVAKIARDIAAGLDAAHSAGIIHRDLKPANVLVARDGRVVLTDFGIARAMESSAKTHETGMILGTPHYMAPEQVSGRPVDARSDIYAFGLILFELLTGELPFAGDTPIAVAAARMHQDPSDLRKDTSIPNALSQLVMACLARDPARRPATIAMVQSALDAFLDKSPGTAASSGLSQSLYAPIVAAEQTLAVLPFIYRGNPNHDYLGEGFAEELIDVLSRTRGLKVLALGATRRFERDRDPSVMLTELGATSIVDGTVQLSGPRVRITARLIDAGSAVQMWNDRFDGSVEDIFTLQESMGGRIAEALRLEVDAAAHAQSAPREAVELYLQARRLLRRDVMIRANEAVGLLDRCLSLAPDFTPGIAQHAVASVRAWWGPVLDKGGERKSKALESAARAVSRAPDFAETHLVTAMLAVQIGEYEKAAQALGRALAIAPTMPEAQQYLGELQVEAGRLKEGRKRLLLTLDLDPTLTISHRRLGRACAPPRGDLQSRHRGHAANSGLAIPVGALPEEHGWSARRMPGAGRPRRRLGRPDCAPHRGGVGRGRHRCRALDAGTPADVARESSFRGSGPTDRHGDLLRCKRARTRCALPDPGRRRCARRCRLAGPLPDPRAAA
jgi:serine/threonine-protein kinase